MLGLIGLLLSILWQPVQGDDQKITIAAAANTQFVMKALVDAFETRHEIKVDLILGSSGKLTTQIINGAPYDLFVAANMAYPMVLHERGLTLQTPRVYAQGVAVIWTLGSHELHGLKSLTETQFERVAVANPKTAPYGTLAVDILKTANLYSELKGKLVYGESISQVNQYVSLGAVDAGITSKSVVLSPEMQGKGKWVQIPDATIDQGVVLLKSNTPNTLRNTKAFYQFLQSPEAQEIFRKYGYLTGT